MNAGEQALAARLKIDKLGELVAVLLLSEGQVHHGLLVMFVFLLSVV